MSPLSGRPNQTDLLRLLQTNRLPVPGPQGLIPVGDHGARLREDPESGLALHGGESVPIANYGSDTPLIVVKEHGLIRCMFVIIRLREAE